MRNILQVAENEALSSKRKSQLLAEAKDALYLPNSGKFSLTFIATQKKVRGSR